LRSAHRPRVAGSDRTIQNEAVRNLLTALHVHNLAEGDDGVHEIGACFRDFHGEDRAPGVADQKDLVLAKAHAENFDQGDGVVHELADVHGSGGRPGIERLASAALVPVHAHEVLLEQWHRPVRQRHLRAAGAAVHVEEQGIRRALPAQQDPLRVAVQIDALQRSDALRAANGRGARAANRGACELQENSVHGQSTILPFRRPASTRRCAAATPASAIRSAMRGVMAPPGGGACSTD